MLKSAPERTLFGDTPALLGEMLAQVSDVVIALDRQGRISYLNASAERQYGVTAADVLGQPFSTIFATEWLDPEDEAKSRALVREGRSWRGENIHVTAAGVRIHVESTVTPIRNSAGDIVGVLAVIRDVTEYRRVVGALKEREQRLSLALSVSRLGVFEWRMTEDRAIWENDRMYEIFGRPREQGPLSSEEFFNQIVLPEDSGPLRELLMDAVKAQSAFQNVCRIRRCGDGELRWVDIAGLIDRDPDGGGHRVIGVVADITDRRLAENAMVAAKEAADTANRAKDRFLATLSHELRTPLTPVLLVAAARQRAMELAPEIRRDFEMIRTNVELEARLIDDLLDVSRVLEGKLNLQSRSCDTHALLKRTVVILRADAEAKGLTLDLHLKSPHSVVVGDELRMQQVFWNVLRNAIKFTPHRGHVSVETEERDGNLVVSIRDTGIGIAAEDLVRIFDAFAQTGQGGDPAYGGLGLGLSISRSLIEKHGGRIWAESEGVDYGATFYVELPLSPSAGSVTEEPTTLPTAAPRRLRILLVEDHKPTREILAGLLQRRGHDVTQAACLQEAREAFRFDRFDLLVSDLGLPDGDGTELVREIREKTSIPAIALSGYGTEGDVRRSLDAGFTEHLLKPVDFAVLEGVIGRLTGQV